MCRLPTLGSRPAAGRHGHAARPCSCCRPLEAPRYGPSHPPGSFRWGHAGWSLAGQRQRRWWRRPGAAGRRPERGWLRLHRGERWPSGQRRGRLPACRQALRCRADKASLWGPGARSPRVFGGPDSRAAWPGPCLSECTLEGCPSAWQAPGRTEQGRVRLASNRSTQCLAHEG